MTSKVQADLAGRVDQVEALTAMLSNARTQIDDQSMKMETLTADLAVHEHSEELLKKDIENLQV